VTPPEFDDLVGTDVPAEERARLRRAHDALVAAGPPPELPPALAPASASTRATTGPRTLPRRRLAASLVLAAAIVLAAFGAGYVVGDRGGEVFETDFVLAMRGTDAAAGARASLIVGAKDDDGNWPMKMTVVGLQQLPDGGRYELVLTKGGKRIASCGVFVIGDRTTVVYLNAPYRLRRYDGWAITREGSDELLVRTAEV
jgi:hypothetical protein